MRNTLLTIAITAFLAVLSVAEPARADLIPRDHVRLQYTVGIENFDERSDLVFVYYPYSFSNEASDQIGFLVAGKDRVSFGRFAVAKLYAIKKADFDLPALEAMKSNALKEYFASDKVYAAPMIFPPVGHYIKESESYQQMHEVIWVGGIVGTTLSASFKSTTYTFEDGTSKELRWFGSERPAPDTKVLPPAETPKSVEPDAPPPTTTPKKTQASKCAAFGAEAWSFIGLALWLTSRRRHRRS